MPPNHNTNINCHYITFSINSIKITAITMHLHYFKIYVIIKF